jgi:hypothetical protein
MTRWQVAALRPLREDKMRKNLRNLRIILYLLGGFLLSACMPVQPAQSCPVDDRLPYYPLPNEHWITGDS